MKNLPISLYQGKCCHVEFITYPDGQQFCQLDMEYFNDVKLPVVISCSIRGFGDLELLLCLVAALQHADFVINSINFVYLFGMRSDRAFAIGQPNYFRDVVAPIINRLPGLHSYYWPHGSIAWHYFKSNSEIIWSVSQHHIPTIDLLFIRIAGDKTAFQQVAVEFDGYFVKKRTANGIDAHLYDNNHQLINSNTYKWIGNILQSSPVINPFLIVDDLCDGGATFLAEGELLKAIWPERKRYLFVAHGLFTKGLDKLLEVFDGIITTNSYQDYKSFAPHDEKFKVIEVIKP